MGSGSPLLPQAIRPTVPGAILRAVYTEHLHIPVGAGTLHIERLGRGGPAVLLLHGFATSAFLWRHAAPHLAAAGLTVVAIDLLGHGESDRPGDALYSASAQADYVERALTALRLGAVTVVAQDVGALVAVMLATLRPSLVRALLLLEPPDPDDLPGPGIRSLQRSSARAALNANTLFGARALLAPWLLERVGSPSDPDRLIARYLSAFVGPNGTADLLQLASHVTLQEEERARLRALRVHTTLWLGVSDGDPALPAGSSPPQDLISAPDSSPEPVQAQRHSALSRERLRAWTTLLPAAPVEALLMPTASDLLVAEIAPRPLARAILARLDVTQATDGEGASIQPTPLSR